MLSVEPYGEGHINRTYLVVTTKKRYILQEMNTKIFPNSGGLMGNICAVTQHLKERGVETLDVIPTIDGRSYYQGEECFRVYAFIENTVTYQSVEDENIFRSAGKAFGEFQNHLSTFNASVLTEILPRFHDTPKRFCDFKEAMKKDEYHRAQTCKEEIAFLLNRQDGYGKIVEGLADGSIPLRVTHNDTKLNNILMDEQTKKARAVIDLDTVMPGSMLYDFGDSIRFGASTAAEDEQDLSKVRFSLPLFKGYAEGFCSAVKESITLKERVLLPYAAYLMTVECGMRFLTDYLSGDTYFATKYQGHNLVRCRTQLKLAKEMDENLSQMQEIIESILS